MGRATPGCYRGAATRECLASVVSRKRGPELEIRSKYRQNKTFREKSTLTERLLQQAGKRYTHGRKSNNIFYVRARTPWSVNGVYT